MRSEDSQEEGFDKENAKGAGSDQGGNSPYVKVGILPLAGRGSDGGERGASMYRI